MTGKTSTQFDVGRFVNPFDRESVQIWRHTFGRNGSLQPFLRFSIWMGIWDQENINGTPI